MDCWYGLYVCTRALIVQSHDDGGISVLIVKGMLLRTDMKVLGQTIQKLQPFLQLDCIRMISVSQFCLQTSRGSRI